jgi:hypothetical protein
MSGGATWGNREVISVTEDRRRECFYWFTEIRQFTGGGRSFGAPSSQCLCHTIGIDEK